MFAGVQNGTLVENGLTYRELYFYLMSAMKVKHSNTYFENLFKDNEFVQFGR